MFRTQFHDIVYAQTSLFCVVLKYERRGVVAPGPADDIIRIRLRFCSAEA
jgi:hypothetical protein